jgi:hypothetical protein
MGLISRPVTGLDIRTTRWNIGAMPSQTDCHCCPARRLVLGLGRASGVVNIVPPLSGIEDAGLVTAMPVANQGLLTSF